MKHSRVTRALLFLLFVGKVCSFNQPPYITFDPPSSSKFVSEDAPKGTSLFSLIGHDDDSFGPLTFSCLNNATSELVTIGQPTNLNGNRWKAIVNLTGRLDRELQATRTLWFKVFDGVDEGQGRIDLILQDVNDNPPYFLNMPNRLDIDEGAEHVTKTVFVVQAVDRDSGPGGSIVYSMTANAQGADFTYNTTFQILRPDRGNITLSLPLDYETRNYYQYTVFAHDRGTPRCPGAQCPCSSETGYNVNCAGDTPTFTVIVHDVQDTPPFFERLPYIATVPENTQNGTTIFRVSAQDGDTGVPNTIEYSIVNENVPFGINLTSGEIFIRAKLDADTPDGPPRYTLLINASEVLKPNQTQRGNTSTTTEMSISVTDINDNAPKFNRTTYTASVNENTPRGVPLDFGNVTIEVDDIDNGQNSRFELIITDEDGRPSSMFATIPKGVVQSSATVTVSVNDSNVLDYEKTHNITFLIVAREVNTVEKFSANATVVLSIIDLNDNTPNITCTPKDVNVSEETPNVFLAQCIATDPDSGDFGKVRFSLENDFAANFSINSENGTLMLTGRLDRETIGSYSLVVIASDNNNAADTNQRRSDRFELKITVTDVNDNPPIFIAHPKEVSVQENASPGTTLLTLSAQDRDNGDNAKVVYEVTSIVPVNNQAPDCRNCFIVDNETGLSGMLKVSEAMDSNNNTILIDHPGSYNVTIAAHDCPQNVSDRKSGSTWVLVNVVDVNIHSPVFVNPDQASYNASALVIANLTIAEELHIGTRVMVLNATDADAGDNGKVYYDLEPDLGGWFRYFVVGAENGFLEIRQPLDREKNGKEMQISLKAEDRGRPRPLSTIIPLKIVLLDIDDNEPKFPMHILRLSVGEESQNVTVGYVNVSTDADEDPHNKINCYYLYGGAQVKEFQVIKATGELRLNAKLDRDQTPSVELIVKATGNCAWPDDHFVGNSNNSFNKSDDSLLQVEITVDDINDNGPVFEKDALTVGLLFDAEIGFQVINLVAFTTDNDTAPNRRNFYKQVNFNPDPSWGSRPNPFSVHANGSVETTTLFSAVDSLVFTLTIMTYDYDNHNDTADLVIYLVSSVVRIRLVFNKQPQEVEALKGEFIRKLGIALGFTVVADKIATHVTTSNTADITKTDMFIHARYIPTGKIVQPVELLRQFDYNQGVRDVFREMGVAESAPVVMAEAQNDNKDLEKSFIIVAVVLAIVVVVLAIVLFNSVRRYRRRLRAATTSAYVTTKEDMSNNYVPPGTNRYFAAENPLFGKDVKPVDVDKNGDNDSLDDNAVDLTKVGGKEREEEQEMYVDLYDEGHRGPGSQLNHLQMVLQEYEKGGSEGYDELSTTQSYLTSSLQDGQEWRSLSGHAKADSGFSEQDLHQLDHLQYSDI